MKKPPRLVATCIAALVLATLFVCSDLSQLGGQIGSAWLQSRPEMQPITTGPSAGPGADSAATMMHETLALQNAMRPFLVVIASLDLLVSFFLIAGAAMTLALSPAGRRIFSAVLVGAIVWDTVGVVVKLFFQWKSQQLMQRFMSDAMADMADPSSGGAGFGSMMNTWMGASAAIGFACAGGWLAVKVAFYVSSLSYLRKPEVTTLFARTDEHGAARAAGMPRG